MIVRIVRLEFEKEKAEDFVSLWEEVKEKVRNQPGCRRLELLRDISEEYVFFTYSYWDAQEDLDRYRHSAFFGETWRRTKALFGGRPMAWSVRSVEVLS